MSDGILVEHDGRMEFFTQSGSLGYVVNDTRRVRLYRRAFVAVPVLILLSLVIAHSSRWWIVASVIVGSAVAAEVLRRTILLRGLPRTEEFVDRATWRRYSTEQSTAYSQIVSAIAVAAIVTVADLPSAHGRVRALAAFGVVCAVTFASMRAFEIWRARRMLGQI